MGELNAMIAHDGSSHPDDWQELLEQYLVTAAALYEMLQNA